MSYYLGLSVLKPPKGYVGKPIARIHVKRLSEKDGEKNLLTNDCFSLREMEHVIDKLMKESLKKLE